MISAFLPVTAVVVPGVNLVSIVRVVMIEWLLAAGADCLLSPLPLFFTYPPSPSSLSFYLPPLPPFHYLLHTLSTSFLLPLSSPLPLSSDPYPDSTLFLRCQTSVVNH